VWCRAFNCYVVGVGKADSESSIVTFVMACSENSHLLPVGWHLGLKLSTHEVAFRKSNIKEFMETLLYTQRSLRDRRSKYGLLLFLVAVMSLLLIYNREVTIILFEDTHAARLSMFVLTELVCLFFVLLIIWNLGSNARYAEYKCLKETILADDEKILSTSDQIINKEEELIGSMGNTLELLTTKVPLKRDDETVTAFVGIVGDLTEWKKMELSLRLSNERFKMACQVTDDAIWDWDIASNDVYFGDNFKNLFGYNWDSQCLNLSEWSRHLHPDDKERVFTSLETFLRSANHSRWEEEYRYICANGQVAYVRDRGLLICNEDGNPIRIIGAMQNVTEVVGYRISLEAMVAERTKELNKALQKEKDMAAVKNRFVSMASHEFRTPLSTIQFASGFLRKFHRRIAPSEIEKKLEGIEKQVHLMTALLDDILTLGRTEAGKLNATLKRLDIVELMDKICAEIETTTRGRCSVERTFPSTGLIVSSDEKFLRNIFVNLVGNAVKFSPEADRVYLAVESSESQVMIRVRDQGVGIPFADLQTIFEPFQRGTNVDNIEGTGLGLSIVKKAVDALGGQLFVKSQVGEGTEFTVKLPIHEKDIAS
jgi:PAS domain S-box-containing protein